MHMAFVSTVTFPPVPVIILLATLVLLGAALARLVPSAPSLDPENEPDDTATSASGEDPAEDQSGRVWIVVNPTKPTDYALFRQQVDEICLTMTGKTAGWLETTPTDPGTTQAIHSLNFDPRVVLAAGGDGTVRAVAAGLAHSMTPMGILPVGTGNVLARNLHLPLDLTGALETAIDGTTATIDLAWLRMERSVVAATLPAEGALVNRALSLNDGVAKQRVGYYPRDDEYAYLVIAGIGFDGETMAKTDPRMKKAVGWPAYVLSALGSLRTERMKAAVTLFSPRGRKRQRLRSLPSILENTQITKKINQAIIDSQTIGSEKSPISHQPAQPYSDEDRKITTFRARTVLLANCGDLPYIKLAPDAVIDDGLLDVIAIDTQGGLIGWANLAIKVFSQGWGIRPFNTRHDFGQIAFEQSPQVRIDTSRAFPVQVDGDPLGTARTVIATVDKGALKINIASRGPQLGTE